MGEQSDHGAVRPREAQQDADPWRARTYGLIFLPALLRALCKDLPTLISVLQAPHTDSGAAKKWTGQGQAAPRLCVLSIAVCHVPSLTKGDLERQPFDSEARTDVQSCGELLGRSRTLGHDKEVSPAGT